MKSKTFITALLLLCIVSLLHGCLYTHIQRPLDSDFQETRLGSKVGKASSQSVLWLIAWGDSGTKAAADNGNIKVITHADTEYEIYFFGIYSKMTTVVYGD